MKTKGDDGMKRLCYEMQLRNVGRMYNEGVLVATIDDQNELVKAEAILTQDFFQILPSKDGIRFVFYEDGDPEALEILLNKFELTLPISFEAQLPEWGLLKIDIAKKIPYRKEYEEEIERYKEFYRL